jgi:hypothetical protein
MSVSSFDCGANIASCPPISWKSDFQNAQGANIPSVVFPLL